MIDKTIRSSNWLGQCIAQNTAILGTLLVEVGNAIFQEWYKIKKWNTTLLKDGVMNKRSSISTFFSKFFKLTILVFTILSFASLSGCLLDENDEEPPPREVRWGLKIQIGQYVKDSIFPPKIEDLVDSSSYDAAYGSYHVSMDSICYYEPGCDTVPRILQIYGWDPTCFSKMRMSSLMGGGSASVPVDSTGLADWSNRGLFNTGLPGGVTFNISPNIINIRECTMDYDYPLVIEVYFNRYTFDSWGEHGL